MSYSRLKKNLCLEILKDKKAEDIKVVDCSDAEYHVANYIIFANGRSNKNVAAIGMAVADKLKEEGIDKVNLEGFKAAEWVLVDIGDVLINVFHPETRARYQLESLWDPKYITEE